MAIVPLAPDPEVTPNDRNHAQAHQPQFPKLTRTTALLYALIVSPTTPANLRELRKLIVGVLGLLAAGGFWRWLTG